MVWDRDSIPLPLYIDHYNLILIFVIVFYQVSLLWCPSSSQFASQLNARNFDQVVQSNEVVFVNFYANW